MSVAMAVGRDPARLTVWVRGRVQGVGFRYWARDLARQLALAGSATNLPDGRVEIVAEGTRASCEQLLAALHGDRAPGFVQDVMVRWSEPGGQPVGFRVR